MKNLSATPPPSPLVAFTIFITLVVCLAGFVEAEVRSNLENDDRGFQGRQEGRRNSPLREKVLYSNRIGGDDQSDLSDLINFQKPNSIEDILRGSSDDFGHSHDLDGDKETDGYGYDDDEYYHLNYKRNDDSTDRIMKSDKETMGEFNKKDALGGKTFMAGKNSKDSQKETETIEMLDFKESHSNQGAADKAQAPTLGVKPFSHEGGHKKTSLGAIVMSDLKENSAIDEKMKGRKEESSGVRNLESKVAEGKKGASKGAAEEKDSLRVQDSKTAEEADKKEKELGLKEGKESVSGKGLKDGLRGVEGNDKIDRLQLNENLKLEENVDKLSKPKESGTAKIAKDDKEASVYGEKTGSEAIDPKGLSQMQSRASLVSNDYKDALEGFKTSPDANGNEKTPTFSYVQGGYGGSDGQKVSDNNLGNSETNPGSGRNYLSVPMTLQSPNEYYKKRELWKLQREIQQRQQQQSQIQQQDQLQQQQEQQQLYQLQQQQQEQQDQQNQMNNYQPAKGSYNFPSKDLENTEYHKNYMKSLMRFKGINMNNKAVGHDSSNYSAVPEESSPGMLQEMNKRSNPLERRFVAFKMEEDKNPNLHSTLRRHAHSESGGKLRRQQPNELEESEPNYPAGWRQARKSPRRSRQETETTSRQTEREKRKDSKAKLSEHSEEKYLKKYPYSQASRDDLTRLKSGSGERKSKRKASVRNRRDESDGSQQKREIKRRGVPLGYYSNRVKFGQRHLERNEEKETGDSKNLEEDPFGFYSAKQSQEFDPSQLSTFDKTLFEPSWDVKKQIYIHDPTKRFDSSGYKSRGSNSLLLLKKDRTGDKVAKVFTDQNSKATADDEIDSDQLAKMLSKDSEYVVLKKKDNNKYQKITDSSSRLDPGPASKKGDLMELGKQDNIKGSNKQPIKNRGIKARSFGGKEEEKCPAKPQESGRDKFKDFADLFRDGEQDAVGEQQSLQEGRERGNIVFSEDKMPDPVVLSGDGGSFKAKPQNSMYSISTNFKQLDQERRNESPKGDSGKMMFASDTKVSGSVWEPALKNAFPEAKTINAVNKNGNEIIVLDFNRNQIKTDHGNHIVLPNKQHATSGGSPLTVPGDRQVKLVLNDGFLPLSRKEDSGYPSGPEGDYAVINTGENHPQITIPLDQLSQLPNIIKGMSEKKSSFDVSKKSVAEKNADEDSSDLEEILRDIQKYSAFDREAPEEKEKLLSKRNLKQYQKSGAPLEEDRYLPEELQQEIESLLQGEGMRGSPEKNYQDELREELSAASERIQRLRRQGMSKSNLQKTIEEALSFRERRHSGGADSVETQDKCNLHPAEEGPKKEEETSEEERRLTEKSLSGSDPENRFSDLLENLPSDKSQKGEIINSKESEDERRKRRKRSPRVDVEDKVSSPEVQNTILDRLKEDNYQSVYSPGIKRKLLSTDVEADYAGCRYNADALQEKQLRPNCAKKSLNKYLDPILELSDDRHETANRARRSLNGGFHSEYKREIDLDESMPNDFQSFLVTSLGGFGSQKREVVKKEDALWEGRGTSPDNLNRMADSDGDSALEKRDVSSKETRRRQSRDSLPESLRPELASGKKVRSQPGPKSKSSQYENEKIPTRIRIQITNASLKEKKFTKPTAEETDTPPTDADKEKEYLDGGKIDQIRAGGLPQLGQYAHAKYAHGAAFEKGDVAGRPGRQKLRYEKRPYRRGRRKKEKYAQESPTKAVKNFITFDQKAMESLLRKYFADQNGMTTQKVPVSNHLPQVETVYNPTQGTNKAQISAARFSKENPLNKNAAAAKTSYQTNEASTFDESILRTLLKGKSAKPKAEKGVGKDLDEVRWRPFGRGQTSDAPFGTLVGPPSDPRASSLYNSYSRSKPAQAPFGGYFSRSSPDGMGANAVYDKLKQEMRDAPKTGPDSKMWSKPFSLDNLAQKPDPDKDKIQAPFANQGGNYPSNGYDFFKSNHGKEKQKGNPLANGFKTTADNPAKPLYITPGFHLKPVRDQQQPVVAPPANSFRPNPTADQYHLPLDGYKESDYLDAVGGDYVDDYQSKPDPQADGLDFDRSAGRLYDKTGNVDDGPCPEEDEADEEYDDSAEEEDDLADYNLVADPEPRISGNLRAGEGGRSAFLAADGASPKTLGVEPSDPEGDGPGLKQSILSNLKSEPNPFGSSTELLKRVNDYSDAFGRNSMTSAHRPGWPESRNKLQGDRVYPGTLRQDDVNLGRRLEKRKMDWGEGPKEGGGRVPVGSRVFFAEVAETQDARNFNPRPGNLPRGLKGKNSGNVYYRLVERNPLKAELRGGEDEFEDECEENGNRFDGNMINGENDGSAQKGGTAVDDVRENLEDDGDVISEDNVLENVIGKYIVRKSVVPLSATAKSRTSSETEGESTAPKNKRSLGGDPSAPRLKSTRKRLFSGHLTESNFRKYHRKNSARKRQVFYEEPEVDAGEGNDAKRSALDIFKKMTNRDKSKKEEEAYGGSAGFEPLVSGTDRKAEESEPKITPSEEESRGEESKPLPESVARNEDGSICDKKKEKSKEELKSRLAPKTEGPWRVELVEKVAEEGGAGGAKGSLQDPGPKTYLLIGKTSRLVKRRAASADASPPPSGAPQREVGTGRRRGERRSGEASPSSPREEGSPTEATTDRSARVPDATAGEPDRALRDANARPPRLAQRDAEASFVTAEERTPDSEEELPSRGRPNRKSAFPPSSDANIIRDSRRLSEETSKQLGRQIVESIFNHVSTNPRFKETIAPGLLSRTTHDQEKPEERKRTLHDLDISEQVQSLLEKVMLDLERLAEKQVKKKMCTKIDESSKQFLQSLLDFPPGDQDRLFVSGEKECPNDRRCQNGEEALDDTTFHSSLSPQKVRINPEVMNSLKKKQLLLKKLMQDYRQLSQNEKNSLGTDYQALEQDLEDGNLESKLSGHSRPSLMDLHTNSGLGTKKSASNHGDHENGAQWVEPAQNEMSSTYPIPLSSPAPPTTALNGVVFDPSPEERAREKQAKAEDTRFPFENVQDLDGGAHFNASQSGAPRKVQPPSSTPQSYILLPYVNPIELPEAVGGNPGGLGATPQPPPTDPKNRKLSLTSDSRAVFPRYSDTPAFPYTVDKKFFTKKVLPFNVHGQKKLYDVDKDNAKYIPLQNFIQSYPPFDKKKSPVFAPPNGVGGKNSTRKRSGRRRRRRRRKRDSLPRRPEGWRLPSSSEGGHQTSKTRQDADLEEPGMEYLIWSSMPPVRRRLNDLELGVEFDGAPPTSLGKTFSRREEKRGGSV